MQNEKKQINWFEVAGFAAIALTVLGQILIAGWYMVGQGCWLVANGLYLYKAVGQQMGRAEVVRNVVMSALTLGLMVLYAVGVLG